MTDHSSAAIENQETRRPTGKLPRIPYLLATVFGFGFIPLGPGTWGSLFGVGISIVMARFEYRALLATLHTGESFWTIGFAPTFLDRVVMVAIAALGVYVASRVARHSQNEDPQFVVIDEVSGQLLALSFPGVVLNWKSWLLGFILFRIFDIWKPFPAHQAESFDAGWGIMADDWVAGIYAGVLLALANHFVHGM
jgi:phosphatidylglycerophosphatase A